MLYKILIKNSNGTCSYAQMKVFDTETRTDTTGASIVVTKDTSHLEDFSTTDVAKVKEKYVELMDQYKPSQLDVVADMKEVISITVDISDADETTSGGTGDADSTDDTTNADDTTDTTPAGGDTQDNQPES